jgi:F-type H+-transporting ATPase subunit epsilon
MALNLRVMTINGVILASEAQEVILSTNSGQIGILPNHAPLLTGLDIGVMKVRSNDQWTAIALMGGFAKIENNELTILVTEAEKAADINLQEAETTFIIAEIKLNQASSRKEQIEANLAFKRAKARLEARLAIT